jgi:hypothetical protein
MLVSDIPSCGITYNHHSDGSVGVIYNLNMFIIQATGNGTKVQAKLTGCRWYTEANILAYYTAECAAPLNGFKAHTLRAIS